MSRRAIAGLLILAGVAASALILVAVSSRSRNPPADPGASFPGASFPSAAAPLPPPPPSPVPSQILPTRTFAGPTQYPPASFAAYGIVAFTSKAVPGDVGRYETICAAYVASFPSTTAVSTPVAEQMVTVWPVETDAVATELDRAPSEGSGPCGKAVAAYGLPTALGALADARRAGARVDGVGPYLLAWSPSARKGRPDALVLVSDLSLVRTGDDAKRVFLDWRRDIESDPELWARGWNMEKLRTTIRLWADRYGTDILKVFGAGGG